MHNKIYSRIYILYMCKTESLCCTLETNTTVVNQIQFNEKKLLQFFIESLRKFSPNFCLLYDSGGKMELLVSLRARDGETPLPLFCYWKKFLLSEETALTSAPASVGPRCQRWVNSENTDVLEMPVHELVHVWALRPLNTYGLSNISRGEIKVLPN